MTAPAGPASLASIQPVPHVFCARFGAYTDEPGEDMGQRGEDTELPVVAAVQQLCANEAGVRVHE